MSDDGAAGIAWLLIGLGFLAWLSWHHSWTNGIWYGVQYKVPFRDVHTSNKPSDCDWTYAPLGKKGCYYKAVVGAFNAAGDLVGGDNAPQYGKDSKTGKPIISYDGGKTWR